MMQGDGGRFWEVHWRLEKRHADIDEWVGPREDFHRFIAPYEVVEGDGNLLVNAGIQNMLDLLLGAGGTTYTNANSHIGVGDSSTAAVASQTDLQAATNKLRMDMEATYPSRASQTISFRSVFGSGDANFTWNEWAIFNHASAGTMLNRKVTALGAKTSGTWTFTVSVTIS